MGYFVTLVHGTFAPDSPLLAPDSALRTYLRGTLDAPIEFGIFRWTGKNSHAERRKAATELQQHLRETVLPSHPNERHFLICHSHGGMVALYALAEPELAQRVSGAVCLATPFITCKERFSTQVAFMFFALFLGLIAGSFVLALVVLPAVFLVIDLGIFALPIGWAALYFGLKWAKSFGIQVYRFVSELIGGWMEKQQKIALERIAIPSVEVRTPFLCAQLTGDEAGIWLRLVRTLSDVPYRVWGTLFVVCTLLGLPVAITWYIIDVVKSGSGLLNGWVVSYIGIVFVAICDFVLLMVVGPIMIVAPKIIRAHGLGFGGERILDNFFMDIGVEYSPHVCENAELQTFGNAQNDSLGFVPRVFLKLRSLDQGAYA